MKANGRQIAVVSFCALAMLVLCVRPPWYWHDDRAAHVSERARMAGHGWLWSPPPTPDDLPAEDGWHPVVWWSKLALQLGAVAACTALLVAGTSVWRRSTAPFRWSST